MRSDFAQRLEIICGAASDALCRVYARLPNPNRGASLQLSGKITGPVCQYAETLQATYPLVDRRAPEWLLAEAAMPEPCFWTPEMPQLYTAEVQLLENDEVVASATRMLGIRRLGASRNQLVFDAKHWVLRAVAANELSETDLHEWHAAETAICVRNPPEALCDAASRAGVLLVAELDQPEVGEIARLDRWPAVGMIAVSGANDLELGRPGHRALFAHRMHADVLVTPAPWANVAIVEVGATEPTIPRTPEWSLPVIAMRRAGTLESAAEGRRRCDQLQRDLARVGQFAGYIV